MTRKSVKTFEQLSVEVYEKFQDTELYVLLMQASYDAELNISNSEMLKQIISNFAILGVVVNFAKGYVPLDIALNQFKLNLPIDMERYKNIEKVVDSLFLALVSIVKKVLKIKDTTNAKVKDVLGKEEPKGENELEVGKTLKLEKDKPIKLEGTYQLEINIERGQEKRNHCINIVRNGSGLKVWCHTSDDPEGAKLYIEIEVGNEYCIGQGNTTLLKMENAKLEKVKNTVKKAIEKRNIERKKSPVSFETEEAERKLEDAEQELEIIKSRIKKLQQDPRLLWFDAVDSADISQEHIIIEYTEDKVIVITDEGAMCSATLTRVK